MSARRCSEGHRLSSDLADVGVILFIEHPTRTASHHAAALLATHLVFQLVVLLVLGDCGPILPLVMGKEYATLTDSIRDFILRQPVIFVATAPLAADGRINLSPKGLSGTTAFLPPPDVVPLPAPLRPPPSGTLATFAYMDVGGSGVETPAHTRENGRITVLAAELSSPDAAPKLVRLYGRGHAMEPGDEGWDAVVRCFDPDAVARYSAASGPAQKLRGIVLVHVTCIRDSCGYGVPRVTVVGDREIFVDKYYNDGVAASAVWERREKSYRNGRSLDGLPGLRRFEGSRDKVGLSAMGGRGFTREVGRLLFAAAFGSVLAIALTRVWS